MNKILITFLSLIFMGCSTMVTTKDLRECQKTCKIETRDMIEVSVKNGEKKCVCDKSSKHMNSFDREILGIESTETCQSSYHKYNKRESDYFNHIMLDLFDFKSHGVEIEFEL